jgi:hypothetical protein
MALTSPEAMAFSNNLIAFGSFRGTPVTPLIVITANSVTAQVFFFLTHFFNDFTILPVFLYEAVWALHNGHRLLL